MNDQLEDMEASLRDASGTDLDITAHDGATDTARRVRDAMSDLDGASANPEINANDSATDVIRSARDAVEDLDGSSANPDINAQDSASSIIMRVRDLASEYAGTAFNATIGIIDHATAPLGQIMQMAQNPMVGMAGVAGVSFGVGDSISNFAGFEAGMSNVQAISGATASELESLTATAEHLGDITKFTATEVSEGFGYMAMAGWDASQMQGGIEGILNLAAASGESLGTTSDIVTDALTAFGLQASDATHFSDVLAQTSASANTNVGLMGETFKYAGTMAGALGYSIEDVALMTGLMANTGLKGSMSGTALNSVFTRLSTNTSGATDAIRELGVEFFNADGTARDLGDVMGELRVATANMTAEEKSAFANTVAGTEAQKGLLAILNASEDDYNSLADAINNADGASQRMSDTMLDNLQGSFTLLQSAVDGVKRSLGEGLSVPLRDIVDSVRDYMPTIKSAIDDFFGGFNESYRSLTLSEDWINADAIGKIDLAWNELIVDPFTEWAGGEGKDLVSRGIVGLFQNASKIIPGGERAGLSSLLSSMLIGRGVVGAVKGVSALNTALTGVSASLAGIAPPVAIATAGIAGLAVAYNAYSSMRVNKSLEDHFGNMALSAEQVRDVASGILDADYLVNIDASLNEISNADELARQAEEALAQNDILEWKVAIGMDLTKQELEQYEQNVGTFIQASMDELSSRSYALNLQVSTILGNSKGGKTLLSEIEEWAQIDQAEMSGLSEQLRATVQSALEDGIISVDEQSAINELQNKINNIMSGWKEAESQAQMDLIRQKFGQVTGEQLTSGAFTDIIDSLAEQRAQATEKLDQASLAFYEALNGAHGKGRIDNSQLEAYRNMWQTAERGQRGIDLTNILGFEMETLQKTYGEQLDSNFASMREKTSESFASLREAFAGKDTGSLVDGLFNGGNMALSSVGMFSGADQKALKQLYKQMESDVSAMQSIIDEYRSTGEAIPQAIMDSFNEAMMIGAASGNMDAAWQVYANQMVADPMNEAIIKGIQDGTINAPDELKNALEIALMQTDGALTIDDVMIQMENLKLDTSQLSDSMNEALGQLNTGGNVFAIDGQNVSVTLGEVFVDSGDALAQIAEAVGMTVQELASYNGIEAGEVTAGMTIRIPPESVTVDTSGMGEASVEQDVKVTAGNVDSSEAKSQAQEDLENTFSEAMPADGTTDVIIEKASDNIPAVYSQVGSELQSAFNQTFPVNASASIHVNYSIANPSATISFGGGGTGSTSVSASIVPHAEGGYFSRAHMGLVAEAGPEYIIPMDGSSRSVDMWKDAGNKLGVFDGNPMFGGSSGGATGGTSGPISISVNPTFNINGGTGGDGSVITAVKRNLQNIVDDIANALSDKLEEVYSNMPVV